MTHDAGCNARCNVVSTDAIMHATTIYELPSYSSVTYTHSIYAHIHYISLSYNIGFAVCLHQGTAALPQADLKTGRHSTPKKIFVQTTTASASIYCYPAIPTSMLSLLQLQKVPSNIMANLHPFIVMFWMESDSTDADTK